MKTQLLCTFTSKDTLQKTLQDIRETYVIVYNYIYILQNKANLDWQKFRNSIILTNTEGTKRIQTRIFEVIEFNQK